MQRNDCLEQISNNDNHMVAPETHDYLLMPRADPNVPIAIW